MSDLASELQRAIALLNRGEAAAADVALEAIAAQHNDIEALLLWAIARARARGPDAALEILDRAAKIAPNAPKVQLRRAAVLRKLDRMAEAAAALDLALRAAPRSAETLGARAGIAEALGAHDEAEDFRRRALSIDPTLLDRYLAEANAAFDRRRLTLAIDLYQRVIDLDPKSLPALADRGAAYLQLGKYAEAARDAEQALRLDAECVPVLSNYAVALNCLGEAEAALSQASRAIKLDENYVDAWINRGLALHSLGDLPDALNSFDRALALRPDSREALYYRGAVLTAVGRRDAAIADFDRGLALKPADADLEYVKGLAFLATGALREGWPLYERRWECRLISMHAPRSRGETPWRGQALDGVLRIWGEQGVGEEILFARLLPHAHARAKRIVQETDPRLVPLYKRTFPRAEGVFAYGEAPPGAEAQIAVGGLGAALNLPAVDGGAFLRADTGNVAALQEKYRALADGRPVVGIAWGSSKSRFAAQRTSSLLEWEPLLKSPYFFVNLQYGEVAQEIAEAQRVLGCEIFRDPEIDQLKDLDGFAAQIAALDQIVSVANTTVHFAGALGKPCVALLSPPTRGLLWYWGVEGERTPWYGSVRLIRRAVKDEWRGAVESAARLVKAIA
ncbi:MAG: tetratricopeptide repeat protein [Alphaproteobacteria bacterium]